MNAQSNRRQTMHWKGPYDVEQTCHALLGCYYTRKRYTGERILNWLLSQRNSHGGFDNTQDTAICVEAFSKFGRFLRRVRNARIRVKSNRGFKKTYTYKKGKRLLWVYNAELNSRTKRVTLRSGWGIRMKGRLRRQYVIAKVTMRYNSVTPMNDNFGLVATVVAKSSKYLEIKMCLSWKQSIASGLLISSVQLPTGYFRNSVACGKKICRNGKCVPDHSCLDQIQDIDGEVVIYLKSMHYRRSFCVVIKAVKCRIVTLRQKVLFITTVQYYTGAQIVLPYRLK